MGEIPCRFDSYHPHHFLYLTGELQMSGIGCNPIEINKDQVEEIKKYKWIRSEQEGHDIGNNKAAEEWREKYAASYREFWEREHLTIRDPEFINSLISTGKLGVRDKNGSLPIGCEYEMIDKEENGNWIIRRV